MADKTLNKWSKLTSLVIVMGQIDITASWYDGLRGIQHHFCGIPAKMCSMGNTRYTQTEEYSLKKNNNLYSSKIPGSWKTKTKELCQIDRLKRHYN